MCAGDIKKSIPANGKPGRATPQKSAAPTAT
ncbi:hypothetical protein, partial [Cronobacter sakazakii]